ncbi:MAG: polymer-forming cytoskeletal protein [Hyphomicrobiaceae bacterium]
MFTRRTDASQAPFSNNGIHAGSPPPLGMQVAEAQAAARHTVHQPEAMEGSADMMEPESVIGNDLTIEGQAITIRCRGTLQINGCIDAELHSRTLVVGNSAVVQGSITAERVDVWGQVSGAIKGARVVLHGSAQVEGDIHAVSLAIEDGALFEGRSRRAPDASSIEPQLSPGSTTGVNEPIPLPRSISSVGD